MFQSVAVIRSLITETMIGSLRKVGQGNLQDKLSSPRQTVRLDRIGDHAAGLLVSARRAAALDAASLAATRRPYGSDVGGRVPAARLRRAE